MDKREGETSGLRSLSVSDSIDRRELFGGLDRNLEIIEKNLKVDIIQRGNELLLKGENSQKAENLLKEMMGVLEKGGELDQQKINYIADLSNEGISYKQENVEKGIICFTHDGKPLRPKTLGQKIYVESIRNHDIVFGIGGRNGENLHCGGDGGQCIEEQRGSEDHPGKTCGGSGRTAGIFAGGSAGKGGSVSAPAV